MHRTERRISARTPVYDHADQVICWANRQRSLELLNNPHVIVMGTKHRVLGFRFEGPDPGHLKLSGSHHRRPMGTPHRHENYYNPPGVWHLDRIPRTLRHYFAGIYG